jgi:hypothetical protein
MRMRFDRIDRPRNNSYLALSILAKQIANPALVPCFVPEMAGLCYGDSTTPTRVFCTILTFQPGLAWSISGRRALAMRVWHPQSQKFQISVLENAQSLSG